MYTVYFWGSVSAWEIVRYWSCSTSYGYTYSFTAELFHHRRVQQDPNKPRVPSAPIPLPLSACRENTSHIPKGISTQGGGPNSPILSRSRLKLRSIRFECSPTLLFTFNIELHEKKRKNGLQNNALTAFVRSDWDFLGFLRGGDFQ